MLAARFQILQIRLLFYMILPPLLQPPCLQGKILTLKPQKKGEEEEKRKAPQSFLDMDENLGMYINRCYAIQAHAIQLEARVCTMDFICIAMGLFSKIVKAM